MHARTKSAAIAALVVLSSVITASGGVGATSPSTEADCAEDADEQPGVSDERIVFGTSMPLSGPVSNIGVPTEASIRAWVDMVNDQGGVTMADGVTREVELIALDDAYDPARTVENVRRLVERDEVFALWGIVGTPPNLAIYDYTNEQEVPHAFLAGGASTWGVGVVEDYPWTIGWQPAYSSEAAIFAEFLAEQHPGATIAVLVQNDDFGYDFLDAFEVAVENTDLEIVAVETYEVTDPTVDQQVIELASSDADAFFNVTVARFAAQAIAKLGELSWDPVHVVISASSSPAAVLEPAGLDNSEGIITARYTKDPNDPQWTDDEAIVSYTEQLAAYAPDVNPLDPTAVYGFAQGQSMEWVLEHSEPVRACFMHTLRNLPGVEIPLLLPDVRLTTGPDDGFPMETMQIIRFVDGAFEPIGDPVEYEGNTPVV